MKNIKVRINKWIEENPEKVAKMKNGARLVSGIAIGAGIVTLRLMFVESCKRMGFNKIVEDGFISLNVPDEDGNFVKAENIEDWDKSVIEFYKL